VSRTPSRILAVNGITVGTTRRTAATMRNSCSGSASNVAPPPWRFTVGAGHPKFRVDPGRREFDQLRRIVGQTGRVTAEKLDDHRCAGVGAAAAAEFGADSAKASYRQHAARNTQKLAHRQIVGAQTRQHVAQDVIDQPLHRCQQQSAHVQPESFALFYRSTPAQSPQPLALPGARLSIYHTTSSHGSTLTSSRLQKWSQRRARSGLLQSGDERFSCPLMLLQ
jgi:hypothetical protein